MNNYLYIGERIETERKRLRISKTEFSERLDIDRKTLYNYINGHNIPDIASLIEWKKIFPDLDIIFILMGIPEKLEANLNLLGIASDIAGKMDLPESLQLELQEFLFYEFSKSNLNDVKISTDEQSILLAYREATSDTKKAICRILDIKD